MGWLNFIQLHNLKAAYFLCVLGYGQTHFWNKSTVTVKGPANASFKPTYAPEQTHFEIEIIRVWKIFYYIHFHKFLSYLSLSIIKARKSGFRIHLKVNKKKSISFSYMMFGFMNV